MHRNRVSLALACSVVGATLALPGAASAQQVEAGAAARLSAQAEANAGWSASVARRSGALARRLVRVSQSQLSQAHRLTMVTVAQANGTVAAVRFSTSVDRTNRRLERVVQRSGGRLEQAAAKAMAANLAMQGDVALALAASGVQAQTPERVSAGGELARRHAQASMELVATIDAASTGRRARRVLAEAVARAATMQTRVSSRLVGLRGTVEGQASKAASDGVCLLARQGRELSATVERSRSSRLVVRPPDGVRTSLGSHTAQVAVQVQADADAVVAPASVQPAPSDQGAPSAQAEANAGAKLGIGPIA